MFINKVKDTFDTDTRVIVITTLVLNLVSHGLKIWGNTHETLMQLVQKLQNFIAKIPAEGNKRCNHATPVIQEL